MSPLLFALVDLRLGLRVRLNRVMRGDWGASAQPWAGSLTHHYGEEMRKGIATLGWWRSTWVGG